METKGVVSPAELTITEEAVTPREFLDLIESTISSQLLDKGRRMQDLAKGIDSANPLLKDIQVSANQLPADLSRLTEVIEAAKKGEGVRVIGRTATERGFLDLGPRPYQEERPKETITEEPLNLDIEEDAKRFVDLICGTFENTTRQDAHAVHGFSELSMVRARDGYQDRYTQLMTGAQDISSDTSYIELLKASVFEGRAIPIQVQGDVRSIDLTKK
ncbi:hypothetical protein HYS93_00295 [Candidatus Daviesbacteria bacterium]|nr:hypothetical protein [Candidatus Daviesbacteria bacterium]